MTVPVVEELASEHHGLLQALHPLAVGLPNQPESLELLTVPAGPKAGVDALTTEETSQLREVPQQQRGVLKTGVGNDGAELGPFCHRAGCGQQDVRVGLASGRVTGAFHVEEQVVGGEHPGHSHLLPAPDLPCQFRHTCDLRPDNPPELHKRRT